MIKRESPALTNKKTHQEEKPQKHQRSFFENLESMTIESRNTSVLREINKNNQSNLMTGKGSEERDATTDGKDTIKVLDPNNILSPHTFSKAIGSEPATDQQIIVPEIDKEQSRQQLRQQQSTITIQPNNVVNMLHFDNTSLDAESIEEFQGFMNAQPGTIEGLTEVFAMINPKTERERRDKMVVNITLPSRKTTLRQMPSMKKRNSVNTR